MPSLRSLPPAFGIIRSRTGKGRNCRVFRSSRISARNGSTPRRVSMKNAVAPSTPADRAPRLPRTRCQATSRNAGSQTRLNTSWNWRPGSSLAHRCSLVWIFCTRSSAQYGKGHCGCDPPVFTGDLQAFQHPCCQLAGSLRHADGFPVLRLLRSLRPIPRPSADVGPARYSPGGTARRAAADGSHVHQEPIDEGDAQLCPGRLATGTPQAFPMASPPAHPFRLRSRPARVHGGRARHTDPDPPGSSRLDAYGASRTGSSRAPSRLACRTRPVWQCQGVPSLSGLLPPSPATPGSGCPQLSRAAATAQRCSLAWISSTRGSAQQRASSSSLVFTGDLLVFQHPEPRDLLAPFAMCRAFPGSDYYGASVPSRGRQPATGLPCLGPDRVSGARAAGDGSHVHRATD